MVSHSLLSHQKLSIDCIAEEFMINHNAAGRKIRQGCMQTRMDVALMQNSDKQYRNPKVKEET